MIKDNSRTITRLIDEMGELAYYESKKSLPMNYVWTPNHLCRYMVDSLRPLCKEGVRMYFETEYGGLPAPALQGRREDVL